MDLILGGVLLGVMEKKDAGWNITCVCIRNFLFRGPHFFEKCGVKKNCMHMAECVLPPVAQSGLGPVQILTIGESFAQST